MFSFKNNLKLKLFAVLSLYSLYSSAGVVDDLNELSNRFHLEKNLNNSEQENKEARAETQVDPINCQNGLLEFAFSGDTILLDTPNSEQYSQVTVSEATQYGDSNHIVKPYFILGDIQYKVRAGPAENFPSRDHKDPMLDTALVMQYMMKGSILNYSVCLESTDPLQTTQQESNIFVFDENKKYKEYLKHPEEAEALSESLMKIPIGAYGKPMCSLLDFEAKTHAAYRWFVTNTPKNIKAQSEYNYHKEVYADLSNASPLCSSIWDGSDPCSQDMAQDETWNVLAEIVPLAELGSHTTHMCIVKIER